MGIPNHFFSDITTLKALNPLEKSVELNADNYLQPKPKRLAIFNFFYRLFHLITKRPINKKLDQICDRVLGEVQAELDSKRPFSISEKKILKKAMKNLNVIIENNGGCKGKAVENQLAVIRLIQAIDPLQQLKNDEEDVPPKNQESLQPLPQEVKIPDNKAEDDQVKDDKKPYAIDEDAKAVIERSRKIVNDVIEACHKKPPAPEAAQEISIEELKKLVHNISGDINIWDIVNNEAEFICTSLNVLESEPDTYKEILPRVIKLIVKKAIDAEVNEDNIIFEILQIHPYQAPDDSFFKELISACFSYELKERLPSFISRLLTHVLIQSSNERAQIFIKAIPIPLVSESLPLIPNPIFAKIIRKFVINMEKTAYQLETALVKLVENRLESNQFSEDCLDIYCKFYYQFSKKIKKTLVQDIILNVAKIKKDDVRKFFERLAIQQEDLNEVCKDLKDMKVLSLLKPRQAAYVFTSQPRDESLYQELFLSYFNNNACAACKDMMSSLPVDFLQSVPPRFKKPYFVLQILLLDINHPILSKKVIELTEEEQTFFLEMFKPNSAEKIKVLNILVSKLGELVSKLGELNPFPPFLEKLINTIVSYQNPPPKV